ncbi:MAG: SPOR domain-containing protein [Magnetococcales bacterium]|nr:SPOR domain-containing protein [Magnetococcales bacterium]
MARLRKSTGWWVIVGSVWSLLLPFLLYAEPIRPASAPSTPASTIRASSAERSDTVAVYVGSYTDINSAEEMRKRLLAFGFPAFLQATAVDQHRFVRVYGGPFQQNSGDVAKLLDTIHGRMGIRGVPVTGVVPPSGDLSASVAPSTAMSSTPLSTGKTAAVQPAPPATAATAAAVPVASSSSSSTHVAAAPPTTVAPAGQEQFIVQLSSVANRASLDSWHAKLKSIGITSFQEDIQVDGRAFIRLIAGPFSSHGQARAAADQIRSSFQIDGKVLRRAANR